MARGSTTHASSPVTSLPKVEYELAKDDVFKLPAGVFDGQARGYGYNDYSEFRRPEYYIRHVEPLESDLAKTVEYDMDEQDQEWLELVNSDRKKDQVDKVTCEAFEIIMDRLEKEWFDLTKNIPKLDFSMPSEDSTCAICDDSEGENSNAIVFCDGCNLAVHQDCYGVPYIPEGQWLCRKCTVLPEHTVDCILCPNEGGAFKQTVDGVWVHLLCAIWVPETRVVNEVFMEPISGLDRVSKGRWKLRCEICGIKNQGACIQCSKPSCFVAFHTTCARKEKLLMPMKSAHGAEPASLTAFCDKHLPPEQQEIRVAALKAEENIHSNNLSTSKSARAYAKTYKLGPPLVPAIVVDRILAYTSRIKIRKKTEFVQQMCRYWSLKREARRGAPLLKRLHLEPWTASGSGKTLSEEEKMMKLDQLKRLKQDLVVVKELADLVKKRETRKLRQAEIIYGILSQALFPHYGPLRLVFEKIMQWDRHDYFKNPVSKQEVPDYFDVIKKPMCWDVIDTRLDCHQYWNIQDYFNDIDLVLDNALLYNKDGTPLFKLAQKIKKDSRALFIDLEKSGFRHSLPRLGSVPPTSVIREERSDAKQEGAETSEFELPCNMLVGDLEPALESLELFVSSEAIRRELNMELDDSTPVVSLFQYELAKMKPPPELSEVDRALDGSMESKRRETTGVKKGGRKAKPKRDRKAEAERARLNKLAREEATAEIDNAEPAEGQSEYGTDGKGKEKEGEFQAMLDESFRASPIRIASTPPAFEDDSRRTAESETSTAEVASRTKKRSSFAPVNQPTVPRVVNTVDNRDSFNFFHLGWILPADQKRGGRAPISQPQQTTQPPPRKKQKTDHGDTKVSVLDTSVEEGQSPDDTGIIDEYRSVSQAVSATEDIDVPHKVLTQPNGTVIIEKLDTPAIRREKSMRRKAERQKLAEASIPTGSTRREGTPRVESGPSVPRSKSFAEAEKDEKLPHRDTFENESDLSELSEDESQEMESERHEDVEEDLPDKREPTRNVSKKKVLKVEQYPESTIVWAKSESFPWWPAVVYSETSPQVPKNVLEAHKSKKQKRKIKLYIVQFYDKSDSWQSVPRERLHMLGEDDKLDEEMLGSNAMQKWKAAASKKDCREAYRRALAEMEVADNSEASGQAK